MSSLKFKRAGAAALGVALCAFFAMQGCGSDAAQTTPPPAVGGSGGGSSGSAGSSSGNAGASGSSSGSAGASGSSSGSAGMSGTAGTGGGDCGDATTCYKCAPSSNDQFHNHCGTGACDCASGMCAQRFDNSTLDLPAPPAPLPALVAPPTPT